jgi:hypothetical protein
MGKDESQVTFTADELKRAVARYGELTEAEREQAYAGILAVAEFGQTAAEHFQEACKLATKGKYPKDRMLDAVVVPSFLIGLLVGLQQTTALKPAQVLEYELAMALLQQSVGHRITAEIIEYGRPAVEIGVLREVVPFQKIRTDRWSCPFIGSGCAIRRVFVKEQGQEHTLYQNPEIRADYDVRDEAAVEKLRRAAFGVHA